MDNSLEFLALPIGTSVLRSTLHTSEGVGLQLLEIRKPEEECIVALLPPMFPLFGWFPVLGLLSDLMPVVAWTPRGSFRQLPAATVLDHTVECYARDAEEIIKQKNLGRIHLVTLCGGSDIAAELISRGRLNVASVASVTPPMPVAEESFSRALTPVARDLLQVLRILANAEGSLARTAYRKLQRLLDVVWGTHSENTIGERADRATYRTLERAQAYARALFTFHHSATLEHKQSRFKKQCHTVPTLLILFEDDELVGCPKHFIESIGGKVTLNVYERGGHAGGTDFPDKIYTSLAQFYKGLRGQGDT